MKKFNLLIVFLLAFITIVPAQNKPFPQNVEYSNGYTSNNISSAILQNWYNYWLNNAFSSCGSDELIKFGYENPNEAVSEGIAYGMLITAYFGNKTKFDNLWAYYKRMSNEHGLMMWHTTCSGAYPELYSEGPASDAEIDAAYALLVAQDQWGGNYKNEAITLINAIKQYETTVCGGISILKPGEWGGCNEMHIDYFDPGYYRVFYEATGDNFWADMANDAYVVLNRAAHPSTGLIPEMCDINGTPVTKTTFNSGPCRLLWRVTRDYLWYGEPQAKTITDNMTNWGNGIGISNIVGEYNIDGTPLVSWRAPFVTGAFVVGAMTHSQSRTDNWADFFETDNVIYGYYNLELRILYALTLTGNYWKPGTSTPPPPQYTLTVTNGTGDGEYVEGTVVDIEADAAPSGQQFAAWTGDISYLSDVNDAATTVTMPAGNVSISASYQTIENGLAIPGKIEAEAYSAMSGIQTQTTSDDGGGENIGWVHAGDWLDYNVDVADAGQYEVTFRIASLTNGAAFDLKQGGTVLTSVNEPATGGWQSWVSVTKTLSLSAGLQTLRIEATGDGWNLNWFEFTDPGNGNTYVLSVTSGTGDGEYAEGTVVNITADAAPSGQQFNGWTGDLQYVANPSSSNTSIIMPAAAVSVTATYATESISCNDYPVPSAGNWILRNEWSNQNGSTLSNVNNALSIDYPQWGKSDFYLIQEGVATSLEAGKEYTVSFDIKGSSVANITEVSVGFSDGYTWYGPTGYAITMTSAGGNVSNSSFTSKEITLTADNTTSGNLTFLISLTGQPNEATSYALQNVSICTVGEDGGGQDVPVTSVAVSPGNASLSIGGTSSLTATVSPSDATNKNVSWSSSNTGIATVDASGAVTAVAEGTAVVTVTTEDGGYTATSNVSVISDPPSNKYEAEDAALTGCYTGSSNAGFSGTGYVDGSTFSSPDAITWNVNGITPGNYDLIIGYSGIFGAKEQELIVNGTSIGNVAFNSTSGFTSLNAGGYNLNTDNIIQLKASWGWMHVDYLELSNLKSGQITSIMQDMNGEKGITMYPNPVEQSEIVHVKHHYETPVEIRISNVQGNVIYVHEFSNKEVISIPTNKFNRGVYILQVNDSIIKLVIQ